MTELVSGPARLNTPQPQSPTRTHVPAFRWSWKLIRVAGIDVYVHGTFLFLIAFLALTNLLAGHGMTVMLRSLVLIGAVFTSVVLHEFGHALMARRFGVRTKDITLLPIGGVARLEKMPDKPAHQLLVALAGPAVNVVIAAMLFGALVQLGWPVGIEGFGYLGGSLVAQLMWLNVSIAVFNLLPGYPMDGGRVLRALLAMRMAPERATQTAARIGQGVAVIFGLVGLLVSPFLIVIAVFVWLGAQVEHSVATVKVALAGLSVRQGMITDFKSVSPTAPLSQVVEFTLAGFQQDFPVLDDDAHLVGVLTHGDVLRGLAEKDATLSVEDAMGDAMETASPKEALNGALTRLYQGSGRVLVVVDDEKVVGLLTAANVGELIAMEAAGGRDAVPV
ncbi:MAG: Zn-dependent protease/predicted transcriptional regulator [Polyangiales bacterium]|jgi:Zn-dependent protease/predicted transcriptional regulator